MRDRVRTPTILTYLKLDFVVETPTNVCICRGAWHLLKCSEVYQIKMHTDNFIYILSFLYKIKPVIVLNANLYNIILSTKHCLLIPCSNSNY